jgi:arylsulfatase
VNDRPNILWICTDQQRFDALGCYGNPWVRTPNLDGLAAGGMLFENAYSQSPVCTPSRASFLTGRYPRTTRARANGQSIPADEVLVTRLLAEAGYAGGLAGKLHLSAAHPSAAPSMERRIDDGYAVFDWSHHSGPAAWPGDSYGAWLRGLGVTYEATPIEGSAHVSSGPAAEHHQTTWCVDRAIEFMTWSGEFAAPWFFSVNMFDPHAPFDPPASYLERYLDRLDEIPLPPYVEGELEDRPVWQRIDHGGAMTGTSFKYDEMTEREHRLVRAAYWAMCDLIDDQVGRLLQALEENGQAQNTLVVFMSDHGEMLGDHGIYLKGPYFYEPAIRIPFLMRLPGVIEPGRRSPALVELVDLAPTLLDAAGLPRHPGMQGRSLWPLLQGDKDLAEHRDDIYCEYYDAMPWHLDPPAWATMVRTREHKLVRAHSDDSGELYDLVRDPGETHNRWDDLDYASVKADLLQRLCDRMAETADPLPPREAHW